MSYTKITTAIIGNTSITPIPHQLAIFTFLFFVRVATINKAINASGHINIRQIHKIIVRIFFFFVKIIITSEA